MSIIAKYKFDGSVYADLIPEFNAEFTDYTVTDEVDSENSNHIIRTIESDVLPTLMRFGSNLDTYVEGSELALLEVLEMNTSGLTSCYRMFKYCTNLTSITCEWDTSKVTDMCAMFHNCNNLTTLDVSKWDTSNVPDMSSMFSYCNNLTSLDVSGFDTSKVTDMSRMFDTCRSLTTLNVSNWNTSNVTNISHMFYNCNKLTSLDVSNWNTSKVTNMQQVFDICYVLNVDVSNWDTSEVTTIYAMFGDCRAISSLDLTKWNTSKMTNMLGTFWGCINLVELNISSWDTSKVTNMRRIFYECNKLTTLDMSNFNTSNVTDMTEILYNTTLLTDIGMIYCDQFTINKVASLLPTDHNITIWVESDDILQYDQYDHITYKTQKVQDTVHLNSPLLKGDTIEVIDGKTYHVHRYEKVVFDGRVDESWVIQDTYQNGNTVCFQHSNLPREKKAGELNFTCDTLVCHRNYPLQTEYDSLNIEGFSINTSVEYGRYAYIRINKNRLNSLNVESFRQWLSKNPVTAIYQLASPYYELISEEPLELTLLDTTDNTINNNSILPSNMTIANKELSTIAIKPSTIYTLSFDKSIEDSEVTIDICGGEQVTTVLNRVELTTPSELGSGIRFISSDGCIVSNVRLLEGSLVESAIPKETFEGLQSSFYDGYIIGENLANEKEDYFYEETGNWGNSRIDFKQNLKANTTYTLVRKISDAKYGLLNGISFYDMAYYTDGTQLQDHNCWYGKDGWYISKYTPIKDVTHFAIIIGNDNSNNGDIRPRIVISDYMIFEGDHTHLSEAELMRYIEKGTSHYEEEDYNHVGKYKVEYKVTGKNKFDINLWNDTVFTDGTPLNITNNTITINAENDDVYSITGANGDEIVRTPHRKYLIKVKPNTTYTLSMQCSNNTVLRRNYIFEYDKNYSQQAVYPYGMDDVVLLTSDTITFTTKKDTVYIGFRIGVWKASSLTYSNIQLEEGTVVTEYEPYKEDIKTYYLSSPLLEGDTIEDVNGVATHVKRYGKIVLDGSDDEDWSVNTSYDTEIRHCYKADSITIFNKDINEPIKFCDRFALADFRATNTGKPTIYTTINTVDKFKLWLKNNPTTVVMKLASPIYEPISTESILCDSYVNGHLDFDSAVPIEKVEFQGFEKSLVYSQSSTKYILQFNSDNVGIIDYIDISGTAQTDVKEVTKGINKFNIKTPSNSGYSWLAIYGIGFNASNIQVVETNEDIDFDYFKGLQSSFEDGLVTDENDENYGKYKVECKIVGKNKFNGELEYGRYNYINGIKEENNNTSYMRFPKLIPIKNGSVRATVFGIDGDVWFVVYNTNGGYIDFGKTYNLSKFDGRVGYISFYAVQPSFADNWYIQIEEGTQATSYEPYKESIHTLYLNSPLLKGDKLVVHEGKLCHYHKMGMVVLDGSEDWKGYENPKVSFDNCICRSLFMGDMQNSKDTTEVLCDKFSYIEKGYMEDVDNISTYTSTYYDNNHIYIRINKNKCTSTDDFKQWLQANPTTVVYELAEPYYEPIEPQISQYSFSTVKDGDMEIITALPIEIDLTYRTDINGVSSIEEQIASIQESTDISSIIDEEVDE